MFTLPPKMCDSRINSKCNSIFHCCGAVFNELDCLKQCYRRRIKSHFENYYSYGRANAFPLQFWRICVTLKVFVTLFAMFSRYLLSIKKRVFVWTSPWHLPIFHSCILILVKIYTYFSALALSFVIFVSIQAQLLTSDAYILPPLLSFYWI